MPVNVADCPGARLETTELPPDVVHVPDPVVVWHVGPLVNTSPATDCVSVTPTFVSVVFPLFVTTNEYVIT